MKPIIAEPPAKKRRATLTKEPEETTPAAETPKGRRKSAPSVPEPEDAPEQAPEPEASGVESRRASRRSTAGFKDFMAQVRGPTRKDSQEKTATVGFQLIFMKYSNFRRRKRSGEVGRSRNRRLNQKKRKKKPKKRQRTRIPRISPFHPCLWKSPR